MLMAISELRVHDSVFLRPDLTETAETWNDSKQKKQHLGFRSNSAFLRDLKQNPNSSKKKKIANVRCFSKHGINNSGNLSEFKPYGKNILQRNTESYLNPHFRGTVSKPSIISITQNTVSEYDLKTSPETASEVVQKFYEAINARDLEGALDYISSQCCYEDMIYSKPFVGIEAVRQHFQNVLSVFPENMIFVIDDISEGDVTKVGMTWHAEIDGKPFPFSRGCSFYRCEEVEGDLRIVYARDIPEPASKPGSSALVILKFVAQIFKRFPQLLDRL